MFGFFKGGYIKWLHVFEMKLTSLCIHVVNVMSLLIDEHELPASPLGNIYLQLVKL